MKIKLLLLALLLLALPFAFAVDNQDQNNATEDAVILNETTGMDTVPGAEVRILQLETAIGRAIDNGNTVIGKIQEKNSSIDVTNLQTIIGKLTDLKAQVTAIDPQANDSVKKYVEYRHTANNLTQEFRTAVKDLIPAGERDTLRKNFDEDKKQRLQELKLQIKNKIMQHNEERTLKMLGKMNASQDILDQVRNGNLTRQEMHELIKNEYQSLDNTTRNRVRSDVREGLMKEKIKTFDAMNKLKQKELNMRQNISEDMKNRLENMKNKSGPMRDGSGPNGNNQDDRRGARQ